MTGYIVDDGEEIYTINQNLPKTKKKIYRRHMKVMRDIKRVWNQIYGIMKMLINHGLDTDDIMKHYVKLFINQSRLK
jgi:hypothetical protein